MLALLRGIRRVWRKTGFNTPLHGDTVLLRVLGTRARRDFLCFHFKESPLGSVFIECLICYFTDFSLHFNFYLSLFGSNLLNFRSASDKNLQLSQLSSPTKALDPPLGLL